MRKRVVVMVVVSIEETIKTMQKKVTGNTLLPQTWISTLLYLSKTFSPLLTQAGMLTVVMISTVGSPTDFSLTNTKLLVLYATTFEPFSIMLTLSLYLYSLDKYNKFII